jgi:class 3 adenylate cyclase/tetratricopeptide (TPR) repeat protein
MKCPSCQSINEESQKFCRSCGARLQTCCSGCGNTILPSDRFCGECGLEIRRKPAKKTERIVNERKLITSLFADISGYTTLAERLDLEEVKDLLSQVFGEIAQIVIKYEGHIEKFAGDEVMALFGVPAAHEDDPVRAVKAASEIHQVMHRISKKVEETIGQSLAVHIGINTGFAITGQLDFEKASASHIAGDAVNVASRLCNLARPGETLVGQDTYELAEGFFDFEAQPPAGLKGKAVPVKAYRVLSPRELPSKRQRLYQRRATLVGRQREMALLAQQMARVRDGETYSAVAICGEAGTGKTRLIEEFKATLDLQRVTWMEGHAYAYTWNISYYPLINMIKRDLAIEEGDTPGQMAVKLEARLEGLGALQEFAPYFGGLLSLPYAAAADMSPEFRSSRLHQAVPNILRALARQDPVVICFEDLHWADPMFLNFLRGAVLEQIPRVILLYTYRPPLDLFSRDEISMMGESYQEINLQDLSSAQIQEMLASILGTAEVPQELRRFVQEKIGTNPFYLQEMINSLIESGILQLDNGNWRLAGAIDESAIPSSIHAVIAGRVDRLEETVKCLLQEASVIGRTIPYEILKRITRHAENLDSHLEQLKDLALFSRSSQWEHEYEFKHALIQEVVYSRLLKKDRQVMHQQIGLAMEQVFADRLPEFYETLAFHFRHSDLSREDLSRKAVHYLRESGRKSLQKYAVQESHEYYQSALQILKQTLGDSEEEKRFLIEFLNEWAPVFYYRADFAGLRGLFLEHQALAESLPDKMLVGSFYVWLSVSLFNFAGRIKESYELNLKALEMLHNSNKNTAIGMGYANIIWCCAEMKLLDEGIRYGEEVLARRDSLDSMGYVLSLGGLGMIYIFKGESEKNFELGRNLVEFGEARSDLRSTVVGYICTSYGHYSTGNFAQAVEWSRKAVELSNDPIFSVWPKLVLGNFFIQTGKFQEADELLREIIPFCRHLGMYYIVEWAQSLYGAALMAGGQYSRGLKLITEAARAFTEGGRFISLYFLEFALAEIYFLMASQRPRLGLWTIIKNLGFILKEVPFAGQKAEMYLRRIIRVGQEIGARGFMQSHAAHNLELLQRLPGKKGKGLEHNSGKYLETR